MFPRALKRIIIGLITIFLLAGAGFGIGTLVSLEKAPAPVVERPEDDEEPKPLRPQTQWVQFFQTRADRFDIAAKIRNPNQKFGGAEVFYRFLLFDADGEKIGEHLGDTYILPMEEKFLVVPAFFLPQKPTRAELVFERITWQEIIDFRASDLIVEDKRFEMLSDDPAFFAKASGIVLNGLPYDIRSIEVAVIAYEGDSPIGANRTDIQTIRSGERRLIEVFWPTPLAGEVTGLDIQAYTDFFENENFIQIHGTPQRFQEFYTPQ